MGLLTLYRAAGPAGIEEIQVCIFKKKKGTHFELTVFKINSASLVSTTHVGILSPHSRLPVNTLISSGGFVVFILKDNLNKLNVFKSKEINSFYVQI